MVFFFFNDTATTEIYTLSLHDALPISFGVIIKIAPAKRDQMKEGGERDERDKECVPERRRIQCRWIKQCVLDPESASRSEEHTSELQSQSNLVCRLLLEKKKAPCTRKIRSSPASRPRLLGCSARKAGASADRH